MLRRLFFWGEGITILHRFHVRMLRRNLCSVSLGVSGKKNCCCSDNSFTPNPTNSNSNSPSCCWSQGCSAALSTATPAAQTSCRMTGDLWQWSQRIWAKKTVQNRTCSYWKSQHLWPIGSSWTPGPAGGRTLTFLWTCEGCNPSGHRSFKVRNAWEVPSTRLIDLIEDGCCRYTHLPELAQDRMEPFSQLFSPPNIESSKNPISKSKM